MLGAMKWWKPDALNVLGDFADFYSVSAHSKSPDRANVLEGELAAVNYALDKLDALGAKEKHFVAGNHEDRLTRYLQDKAPELFGIVSIPELFKLKSRGWTYTPYKQSRKQGEISITHDCGGAGANAHVKAGDTFQGNVVIGHVHRMAVTYSGNALGKTHVAASFGWLGDVEAIDYMHRVSALRSWNLGFGIGYQEASGVVHLQAVPIIDYSLVLEGRLFRG